MRVVRIPIRVRPGASRTKVGGTYDDRLVVAVSARAVDGAATEAALTALANAFGVRPASVSLVQGRTSRDKVVEISPAGSDDGARLVARLAELLG